MNRAKKDYEARIIDSRKKRIIDSDGRPHTIVTRRRERLGQRWTTFEGTERALRGHFKIRDSKVRQRLIALFDMRESWGVAPLMDHFPDMTEAAVRECLRRLCDDGIVTKGSLGRFYAS